VQSRWKKGRAKTTNGGEIHSKKGKIRTEESFHDKGVHVESIQIQKKKQHERRKIENGIVPYEGPCKRRKLEKGRDGKARACDTRTRRGAGGEKCENIRHDEPNR